MKFGIREKVALLVMVATAVSSLIVAQILSHRATEVLREHELVDLGDEAALRGWELIDKFSGLRDDLVSIAFSPTFGGDVEAGKSREELLSMAHGLSRYWSRHLRIDLIDMRGDAPDSLVITERARVEEPDLWFPDMGEDTQSKLRFSPIMRTRLLRVDGPEGEPVERWEPVLWAVAPLEYAHDGESVYVRILMTVEPSQSPRHLYALEDAEGNQLVRHDESDPPERGNDEVFRALGEDPLLQAALARRRERSDEGGGERREEVRVDRLVVQQYVPLNSHYYFQEGLPRKFLTDALNFETDEALEELIADLREKAGGVGRVGGLRSGVREIRMLAHSRENLEALRRLVASELEGRYGANFDGVRWRAVVECDGIHTWAVRVLVGGRVEWQEEYLIHYAVLDDELASSIEYEMAALRNIALLVAGGFGVIGFFMAMQFSRPLSEMARTAQRIASSRRESLYKQVGALARSLEIRRRDEVGEIARASKRLFEELVASSAELEDRVAERTRELSRANMELEGANEKLMSLSQEKDQFVAKVSHDLRQPLNAIFLQVEALKLSDLDEGQRKDVQRIHDYAARELNLVNDILEYQKIIMGVETLSKDQVDVPRLLEDLAEVHRGSLRSDAVALEARCGDGAGKLVADERRLRQVLGNLLGNACKFTAEGSVVLEAAATRHEGEDWIEFSVSDTGRGMSPEEQSKVFVPFVSNKKDNTGGSGLGLSICRELVIQMGGLIGFISELGKGTRFTVRLPRHPVSSYYEKRPAPAPAARKGGGDDGGAAAPQGPRDTTVLVVDDEDGVRDILSRVLKEQGHRVLTAADGEEGLALARRHLPDAITLDVVMPGGRDGWEILRELKEDPATCAIPVVMVSVVADQGQGLALEVEDYLVKPVDVERLGEVVARATSQVHQRNLLLVDDDREALETMSRVLEAAGWHTVLAEDGAEALAALEKTRPAAIVLDLMMPGMDGFEFLERVQRHPHHRSIPVVVMTGMDTSPDERDFLGQRVEEVLKKGRRSAEELVELVNARLRPGDGTG